MPRTLRFRLLTLISGLLLSSTAQATNCAFTSFDQILKSSDVVVQIEVVQQSKVTGP